MNHKEDVKKRVDSVKQGVGEECVGVLRKAGIDVDQAIGKIVSENIMKEAGVKERLGLALPKDCMTSELLLMTEKEEDVYHKEFERRMTLLGLTKEQVEKIENEDKEIIKARNLSPEARDVRWSCFFFIMDGKGVEDMPKPEQLTLSELIMIIDDANAALWRDHGWLQDKTFKIIPHVLGIDDEGNCKHSPYYDEFEKRTGGYGLTKDQKASFVGNESLVLKRLKWGYGNEPAWLPETMADRIARE